MKLNCPKFTAPISSWRVLLGGRVTRCSQCGTESVRSLSPLKALTFGWPRVPCRVHEPAWQAVERRARGIGPRSTVGRGRCIPRPESASCRSDAPACALRPSQPWACPCAHTCAGSTPRALTCCCAAPPRPADHHGVGIHPRVNIGSARWVRFRSAPTPA